MNAQTLPLPNPGDWMTLAAVACLLGVDLSTVSRMLDDERLTRYTPVPGPAEQRPALMCWRPEVLELHAARQRVKGRPGA